MPTLKQMYDILSRSSFVCESIQLMSGTRMACRAIARYLNDRLPDNCNLFAVVHEEVDSSCFSVRWKTKSYALDVQYFETNENETETLEFEPKVDVHRSNGFWQEPDCVREILEESEDDPDAPDFAIEVTTFPPEGTGL